MNQNDERDETLIHSLKKQIIRYRNEADREEEAKLYACKALLESWRELYMMDMDEGMLETMIWKFFENPPQKLNFKIPVESEIFGLRTIIKDYTNLKGRTHKAHFTHSDKYLGSVLKYGKEPISYKGYFALNKTNFSIDLSRLINAKLFRDIFVPNRIDFEDTSQEDYKVGNE